MADDYRPGLRYSPTLDDRKRQALEFVRLGMKPYEALLLADCSDAEIARLDTDPAFNRELTQHTALRKKGLLEAINRISKANEERGISTELRWMAEKLHSEDFGNKVFVQNNSPDLPQPVVRERD